MQDLFTAWLALPVPMIFASLFAFYLATTALIVWISFRSPVREHVQAVKGVVAPFFSSVAVIFGLLVAFLSNDIWDRNKDAQRVILTEADTLVALHSLSVAAGADSNALRTAIRGYAGAVVEDEWPKLKLQERSARTDAALDSLLRAVTATVKAAGLDVSDISTLYFTGGSSGMTALRNVFVRAYPHSRVVVGDLFGSVVSGLGIDAARRFASGPL